MWGSSLMPWQRENPRLISLQLELAPDAFDKERTRFTALNGHHLVAELHPVMASLASAFVHLETEIVRSGVLGEVPDQCVALYLSSPRRGEDALTFLLGRQA